MLQDYHYRFSQVRGYLASEGFDSLLVTHLPNVRYLTGFVGTAGSLLLAADRAVLVVDFRYATAAAALRSADDGLVELVVAERNPEDALVAAIRGSGSRRVGVEAAYMPLAQFNRLVRALGPSQTLLPGERLVERARIVKDASEIVTLREAAHRLSAVGRAARAFVVAGRTERAIAADIDAAIRRAGFERPAFETIVASGPNSALPHARPTGRTLRDGEGVVLDFGGVYDGYCVDLTRTINLGARSDALRRIFAAVAEARTAALDAVKPGVLSSAVDAAARAVLERHGLGEAFGHGTGHGLGLEVHEEPRLTRAGTAHPDSPLEAGMVFTIEPGAYVAGVGGVRLEDDVLVTGDGAELLTDVPIE